MPEKSKLECSALFRSKLIEFLDGTSIWLIF